jgi:hypothetical protein
MTPEEAARVTAGAIGDLPSKFMMAAATYERGGELGFDGVDFYVAGRGGALGPVDADVVSAAFIFFNPEGIAESWARAALVMAPPKAALEFAAACHGWASAHLPEGKLDYERLAELAGTLVRRADVAGAPLFAGWRSLPEPGDPRALAVHRLNALRELRNARHGGAVLAAGLEPVQALMVKTPVMAAVFGWTGELPDPEPHREAWAQAEAATDRGMARVFRSLDGEERAEFAHLLAVAATK